MRISSGSLKGRKVGSRRVFSRKTGNDELRPTAAKVREAVFNILQHEIVGSVFLDLYAGTGTIGLEAFSRGASQVVLVEKDGVRADAIKRYVKEIGAESSIDVHREKAEYFMKRAAAADAVFDIIFADPPYASGEIERIFNSLVKNVILKHGGFFMIEHSSKSVLPPHPDTLQLLKKYRYGDTALTLYRKAL